ncbi:MAG: hypothetical protein HYW89_00525 [Candidatus Sungiibacteriota bacterium]|uniref:Uncharacterized protein n=1 Tax=Candidatus Sungiibacteriota bacterium TaxID=2750080 RepID=A0A7T5US85_9BACT|nr:MAG: hypothetical protein HYW89_00525 [Candidatus Sungbacteria bacterium]
MEQDGKYIWTSHSRIKLRQYRLSESRIKRIIRYPARTEEGILENAIAVMAPAGGKKYSEIWTMYILTREGGSLAPPFAAHKGNLAFSSRNKGRGSTAHPLAGSIKKIKIITAWRYPGKSPKRDPIPPEILREIKSIV